MVGVAVERRAELIGAHVLLQQRLADRPLSTALRLPRRDVHHRSGGAGQSDPAAGSDVLRVEGGVDVDTDTARAAFRRDGDLVDGRPAGQSPERRGREVAQDRVRAACENGSGGACDTLGAGMAHRVHATVDGNQLSLLDPQSDLAPGEPERDQLLVCDVPVLLGREGGDSGVAWNVKHRIGAERSKALLSPPFR